MNNRGASSSSKKHKPHNSISAHDPYGQPAYSPSIPKASPYLYNSGTKGSGIIRENSYMLKMQYIYVTLASTPSSTGKSSEDRQDTEQLQDALVSAGEEEHNMSRSYDYAFASNTLSLEEDRTKVTDFLNPIPLNDLIYRIAISNSLKTIDPDVAPLLALSLRNRMAGLLSDMIILSQHRTASPPVNRKIVDDVGKILEEIDIKEKDMEEKRRAQLLSKRLEEKNRIDKQGLLSGNLDDIDKKKKKKEAGSSSASKNLSEDAQKRNTDTTAAIMMGSGPNGPGGKKYSWMTSTPSLSPGYTSKIHRVSDNSPQTSFKTTIVQPVQETGIITIRDALNVLEMDKEGAGEIFGRGARALSRGYIRLKD
ncbi:hypothetical protein PORY_000224 [Pneumocystis oryctolagi]|uniref:Uncharacterized protein n=1 Tax=Pneumocystis oryctolagi TaxID=42067 RepID=A0ACB7CF78_9ASCO|nr:hypothetical protein PORY_000224 [Pneumocystis oryctolagi]